MRVVSCLKILAPDAKALAVIAKIFSIATKNVSKGDPLLLLKYFSACMVREVAHKCTL